MKLTVVLVDNKAETPDQYSIELASVMLRERGPNTVTLVVKDLTLADIHVLPGTDLVLRFEA